MHLRSYFVQSYYLLFFVPQYVSPTSSAFSGFLFPTMLPVKQSELVAFLYPFNQTLQNVVRNEATVANTLVSEHRS